MSDAIINAPFTPDQVLHLNRWQQLGHVHPFTCGRRGDGAHGDGEGVLVATVNGWICPFCSWTQDWAHACMAEEAVPVDVPPTTGDPKDLRAWLTPAPDGRDGVLDEMSMRGILSEEIRERGGPKEYLDMLGNKWMEIDSELPPELSAALAAMKRISCNRCGATGSFKMVPEDDASRPYSDSTLPLDMIEAGSDAIDKADMDLRNYVAGETPDWDSGMIAVAVYRAMLAKAPSPPQQGETSEVTINCSDLATLHHMARRYADGRKSYAVGQFNDITRKLVTAGKIPSEPFVADKTIWARDGDGDRQMDGLSDQEAACGEDWVNRDLERIRASTPRYR